jgi:uncharacterized protein YbbK (DUF523 family)
MKNRLKKERILVSACLLNIACRPNAKAKEDKTLLNLLAKKICFVLCPEILAGFSIPRSRLEIKGGDGEDVLDGKAKIFTEKGFDITDKMLNAARVVLEFCQKAGVKKVIFKEKSPSCGKNFIYDGTFSGKLIKGKGVVTAFLQREGIEVFSEGEYKKKRKYQKD